MLGCCQLPAESYNSFIQQNWHVTLKAFGVVTSGVFILIFSAKSNANVADSVRRSHQMQRSAGPSLKVQCTLKLQYAVPGLYS